jgi:hypothetical protein
MNLTTLKLKVHVEMLRWRQQFSYIHIAIKMTMTFCPILNQLFITIVMEFDILMEESGQLQTLGAFASGEKSPDVC